MIDLDRLSYKTYGNLVIIVLVCLALLLNLFPFSLLELVMCLLQIPMYLVVRGHLKEPIHANGLNICFVLTIIFYIFLFLSLKFTAFLMGETFGMVFSTMLNVLGCYATSTVPNNMEEKGKIFFGYKKQNESKYLKLIEYIKFNGLDPKLMEAEERLQNLDSQLYLLYKRKFRENKTFKDINEEFDIENPRIVEGLDKVYYYMIGALGI